MDEFVVVLPQILHRKLEVLICTASSMGSLYTVGSLRTHST